MGTPFYMSPEQIQDVKRVDARSDLYSLGATLYHMLTGVPPFQGESVYSIIHKVMNDPVPDPREKKPEVSEFAARLCMRMMSKDRLDAFGQRGIETIRERFLPEPHVKKLTMIYEGAK